MRSFRGFSLGASTANGYPFTKNQFALPAQISLPASKAAGYPSGEKSIYGCLLFFANSKQSECDYTHTKLILIFGISQTLFYRIRL